MMRRAFRRLRDWWASVGEYDCRRDGHCWTPILPPSPPRLVGDGVWRVWASYQCQVCGMEHHIQICVREGDFLPEPDPFLGLPPRGMG